ncbi:MAG: IS3 family transposase [Nitrospira sp.]|nr:IS3 family transposase [Nitrospira sp.]
MKRSRFTETQIVSILKEAEAGRGVKELCRTHGISEATFYNGKSKYGGLSASELHRLRETEVELGKLKRMYADLALENRALKDLLEKKPLGTQEKREAIGYLAATDGVSIQRSCRCVGLSRAAWYRTPAARVEADRAVLAVLQALVDRYPRWGLWKYFKLLRRQQYAWNHKRVYRIYCALRLNQKRRAKRRVPERKRHPLEVPAQPNQVWSADFMSAALYGGLRFRTFKVIDDFNRESLAVEIDTSLTGRRLSRLFERLRLERGLPQRLRVDNGPEFLSADFVTWAEAAGLVIQYIPKGEPNQNAYIERFHRTYREEVLNLYLFRNLAEVRETTHWWRLDYNEHRPHDALEGRTPAECINQNAKDSSFELSP